jgi:signal transduction histidine kinase
MLKMIKNKLIKSGVRKSRLSQSRLRLMFILFFFALAIPSSIISYNAYEKLRWETFHQFQQTARSLAIEINSALTEAIIKEESRSDTDYTFLILEGDPNANFLQRSDLSRFPVKSDLPGVIGYFQVDANGGFSSPLLPSNANQSNLYGIADEDKLLRKKLAFELHNILSENQLVSYAVKQKEESLNQVTKQRTTPALEAQDGSIAAQDYSNSDSLQSAAVDELDSESLAQEKADRLLQEKEFEAKRIIAITGSRIKKESLERSKRDKSYGFSQLESEVQQQEISKELGAQQGYATQPTEEEFNYQQLSDTKSNQLTSAKRSKRKEQNYLPEQANGLGKKETLPVEQGQNNVTRLAVSETNLPTTTIAEKRAQSDTQYGTQNIKLFESELEPFRFSLLKSGHFVAYRQVWRNGNRLIQGAILSVADFFDVAIKSRFERSLLADFTRLNIAYGGNLLTSFPKKEMSYRSKREPVNGELLSSTNLAEPFGQLSLVFHTVNMPSGESGKFILMIASLLVLALIFGTYALYRLTYRQTLLAQQHQDFISSVSHELRTPITSIKMYGEILKQGWANKEKREEYYDFIYCEAERLSRLIANILQISKVSRDNLNLDLKVVSISELADIIHSKIDSQLVQGGFESSIETEHELDKALVSIDLDAFTQIIINLVDNAIKYSAQSKLKKVAIGLSLPKDNWLQISIRDFGPGIAKDQREKVFELFYRIGNEMTRESKGTGIGLALVKELTQAMNGEIEVINQNPGAEFKLSFPLLDAKT